jgi:transglutaminase/protease-like cytokinesis protein 3
MSAHYPIQFTLEDGIHVEVNKKSDATYDFRLTPKEGSARHFTFVDDARSKEEKTASLDFDQLNAVRAFWLKEHDVI